MKRRWTLSAGGLASLPLALALAQEGPLAAQVEIFAPGVVSVPGASVYRGAFDPTGTAFYFFRKVAEEEEGEEYRIFVTHRRGGGWSSPERVFAGEYSDLYPTISPDGRRMVFTSYRPLPGDTAPAAKANLWYVDRTAHGWGRPRFMAQASTTANYDAKPVYQADGAVHFTSTLPDWRTRVHLLTRWDGREFGPPVSDPRSVARQGWVLPDSARFYVWDFEESPDGAFAILEVSQIRDGRRGPSDLWIAFREGQGWSAPRPLDGVNSTGYDNFFLFSPDGADMLFVRDFSTYYRVPARALRALGP
jgi:hypothetical protein